MIFFTIAKSQNNCLSFVFDAKHRQLFDTIVAKCEKHSKNHDNIYCDDFENCWKKKCEMSKKNYVWWTKNAWIDVDIHHVFKQKFAFIYHNNNKNTRDYHVIKKTITSSHCYEQIMNMLLNVIYFANEDEKSISIKKTIVKIKNLRKINIWLIMSILIFLMRKILAQNINIAIFVSNIFFFLKINFNYKI